MSKWKSEAPCSKCGAMMHNDFTCDKCDDDGRKLKHDRALAKDAKVRERDFLFLDDAHVYRLADIKAIGPGIVAGSTCVELRTGHAHSVKGCNPTAAIKKFREALRHADNG